LLEEEKKFVNQPNHDTEFNEYTQKIKLSLSNCKAKIENYEEDELSDKIDDLDQKIEKIKSSKAQKCKQILAPELKKIISTMDEYLKK